MPLINISGYQYYILKHFFGHRKQHPAYPIRIVDRKTWGDACNPSTSNHTMELWSSPQFRISDQYINISLWGQCREDIRDYFSASATDQVYALECNSSWYYSTSTLDTYCKSSVQLPVQKFYTSSRPIFASIYQGFKIKWSLCAGCEQCESKKELCIYDTSNSTQLRCKSLSRPGKCCNSLVYLFGGWSKSVEIYISRKILFLNFFPIFPKHNTKNSLCHRR